MTGVRNATATTVRGPDLPVTGVRNDTATTVRGQCGADFTAVGRRRWCSDACRQSAWRRRRAAPRPTQPAKIDTVYECPQCQTRYLGTQCCDDCNTWCRRLGPGANCPHCDDLVAVSDLVADNQFGVNPTTRPMKTSGDPLVT